MIDDDNERFVAALVACAEYYGKDLSSAIIGIYWEGLKRYDWLAVMEALSLHMRDTDSGQFMPKISDITKLIDGSNEDSAMLAWSKLDMAVRSIGPYQDVAFDDPIIHRVVADMGGWVQLGTKTDDEWPFVARDFQARYRGYRKRDSVGQYPPVLIGITNATNRPNGYHDEAPVLIGNEQRARLTMQHGTAGPIHAIKRLGQVAEVLGQKFLTQSDSSHG